MREPAGHPEAAHREAESGARMHATFASGQPKPLTVSLPRQILSGSTYMITRRVTQRQFQLLPSVLINQIVLYCIAVAARETGVIVHAVCALSNHIHLIVTDPNGMLPKFCYILFKYVGKCVNVHRDRGENLFAGGVQPSYVRLEDEKAMVEKMAYVVTNPVAAGLVHTSAKWPGVNLWRPGTYKTRKPPVFFRKNGPMPETLPLEIAPVPLGPDLGQLAVVERVAQAIAAREAKLRAQHEAAGRTYLGVKGVLAQKPTDTPSTREPRRHVSPRIAARDKWHRVEAIQRLKSFLHDYKVALKAWCAGQRDVLFPAGVYKMRVEFGVRCAEP
jgi:putative transposase